MHLIMGYDGNPSKNISDECFRIAREIIERCARLL